MATLNNTNINLWQDEYKALRDSMTLNSTSNSIVGNNTIGHDLVCSITSDKPEPVPDISEYIHNFHMIVNDKRNCMVLFEPHESSETVDVRILDLLSQQTKCQRMNKEDARSLYNSYMDDDCWSPIKDI